MTKEVEVRFEPGGHVVFVAPGTSLFDAASRAGLPVASACGADATCGKCGLRILSGTIDSASAHEARVIAANRVDPSLRLSCMVVVREPLVITADYW